MLKELENQKFINVLLSNKGTEIFVVGGYVRDMLLGTASNDIDLLVTGLSHSDIENKISKFGKLVETSGFFATIKFRPFNWDSKLDDIDIVIPRKDVAMNDSEFAELLLTNPSANRHHAFKIITDVNLSPLEDLKRRDIKINSLGLNIVTNELLDPFNGKSDIKNKIISMTNEKTFVEDPVRMIRALRFANRYNFKIESKTFQAIKDNAHLILDMSEERLLIELQKTFKSNGNLIDFVNDFQKVGFQELIFTPPFQHDNCLTDMLSETNRFSEFLFILMGVQHNPSKVFLQSIKGDNETAKELNVLDLGVFCEHEPTNHLIFNMFKIISDLATSPLFTVETNNLITEFNDNKWLKSMNDLAINGNQIMTLLGIDSSNIKERGKEIGKTQKAIKDAILDDELKNDFDSIVKFIKNKTN